MWNEDDKLEEEVDVQRRTTTERLVGGAVGPAYGLMKVFFRDLLDLYTPQKLKERCLTAVCPPSQGVSSALSLRWNHISRGQCALKSTLHLANQWMIMAVEWTGC